MPEQGIFITGTDTEIGKTVLSAVLTQGLDGTYWKPVQSGTLDGTDTRTIAGWLGPHRVLPERYVLSQPLSPHLSARLDGVRIELNDFALPECGRTLIVEGAGGLLVPLNERHTMLDLIQKLGLPVVLAARSGLGTINHSLLSLHAMHLRGLDVRGVVLIGKANPENRAAIEHFGLTPVIGQIPPLECLDAKTFQEIFAGFDQAAFTVSVT